MPQTTVSRIFHAVLSALSKSIVAKLLDTKHITFAEAVAHNTVFTKCFYEDKVSRILNETYSYIQKSADHILQRSSLSGQKRSNLVKLMSVMFPDGYVLDTIDPLLGN